ncbi:MAG: hypothetical protein LBC87_04010 [Fibromonadaceae bacterium]|jgi:hypothetical protein|nr:hypothetical protein [Fibromonadaceae bacterium]
MEEQKNRTVWESYLPALESCLERAKEDRGTKYQPLYEMAQLALSLIPPKEQRILIAEQATLLLSAEEPERDLPACTEACIFADNLNIDRNIAMEWYICCAKNEWSDKHNNPILNWQDSLRLFAMQLLQTGGS